MISDDYLNQEVMVSEEIKELEVAGKVYKIEVHQLLDNPIIDEIKSQYKPVRVILPNTFTTSDYNPSRMNLVVSKLDNKFIISSIYFG